MYCLGASWPFLFTVFELYFASHNILSIFYFIFKFSYTLSLLLLLSSDSMAFLHDESVFAPVLFFKWYSSSSVLNHRRKKKPCYTDTFVVLWKEKVDRNVFEKNIWLISILAYDILSSRVEAPSLRRSTHISANWTSLE